MTLCCMLAPLIDRVAFIAGLPTMKAVQAPEKPGCYSISMITCSCHICGSFFDVASQASAFLIG
ncbi:hypothetical protein D3C78_1793380 [compost metagenome]